MKLSKLAPVAVLTAVALSLTACAANESPATSSKGGSSLSGTLAGKGASSMNAAMKQWISDFQGANPGVTVNYSPDGSGAGRDGFVAGAVAFAGSDRPFKDEEMGAGKFGKCAADSSALNLPVYVSPIAIIFNVAGVTSLKLDAATAAAIFKGEITSWKDPKIAALNPGVTFPEANITTVHRSDDSGTTANFTDWLAQASAGVWDQEADGMWPTAYASGDAAKGTSGVVDALTKGQNTIGYADASAAGSLGKAEVKVGEKFTGPSAEAAAKILEESKQLPGRDAHDLAFALNRTAAGVYPATLVSYALVCQTYKDAKDAELVKAFVGYAASGPGQSAAQKSAGSAPLTAALQAKVKSAIDSIK